MERRFFQRLFPVFMKYTVTRTQVCGKKKDFAGLPRIYRYTVGFSSEAGWRKPAVF
jgi:hypothetical protein